MTVIGSFGSESHPTSSCHKNNIHNYVAGYKTNIQELTADLTDLPNILLLSVPLSVPLSVLFRELRAQAIRSHHHHTHTPLSSVASPLTSLIHEPMHGPSVGSRSCCLKLFRATGIRGDLFPMENKGRRRVVIAKRKKLLELAI